MTAEQLVEKSKEQRKRERREEALISATRATEINPTSAEAWWQVALNSLDLHGPKAALVALRKTTQLAPQFAYGWTLLGRTLRTVDKPKSARICFERAIREDPDEPNALFELAEIYRAVADADSELCVLEALERLDLIEGLLLNRIGILHHQKQHFYKAIHYYKRYAALNSGPAGLFNLGLVFSEISQDADAIDCWRLCAKRYPEYSRANDALGKALPRMVALAGRVRERKIDLLDQDQQYCNYLNPFELLNVTAAAETDLHDTKVLQKLRKALLLEIDLEDGRIEWMPGLHIDRSRAIGICDELNDADLGTYHRHVFADARLLGFLSRGDLSHFTVDERHSPLGTIELLESPPRGFQEWLDEKFVSQFDLVFSKALEKRDLLAVEVLLDGRRWVSLGAADRCFRGAFRQVDRMLDRLRLYASSTSKAKPSLKRVQDILDDGGFGQILSLLPVDFHALQDEATLGMASRRCRRDSCRRQSALDEGAIRLVEQWERSQDFADFFRLPTASHLSLRAPHSAIRRQSRTGRRMPRSSRMYACTDLQRRPLSISWTSSGDSQSTRHNRPFRPRRSLAVRRLSCSSRVAQRCTHLGQAVLISSSIAGGSYLNTS